MNAAADAAAAGPAPDIDSKDDLFDDIDKIFKRGSAKRDNYDF